MNMGTEFIMVGRTNAPFTHKNTIYGIIHNVYMSVFHKNFLTHLSVKFTLN